MAMRSDQHRKRDGTMPFVVVLGLLIAVSLLSALIPLGPPASTHVGPAFSPATTSVAIKAQVAERVTQVRHAAPPSLDPPLALAAAGGPAIPALPVLVLLVLLALPVADRRRLIRLARRPARAPPRPLHPAA